jgi:dTMP kinase
MGRRNFDDACRRVKRALLLNFNFGDPRCLRSLYPDELCAAGFIVLADRYIYTLMARDLVRGMDEKWLKNIYSIALVPDAVFYFEVPPEELVQRNLSKSATLDYWESGVDIGLSRDVFDCFLKYQEAMHGVFRRMQKTYGFTILDGSCSAEDVHEELKKKISAVLAGK